MVAFFVILIMDKAAYLRQFHHFQINRELYFAPKFRAALKHQYQQFITAYKRGESKHNALMNISSHGIYTVLKSLYHDSVHYGSLIYSQLPKATSKQKRRAPIGFNQLMIDLINAYFEDSNGWINIAEGITDTTRDLIITVLEIANEEGRGIDWIVTALEEEENSDLTRNRARLIARTESVTASNQAAYFAAAKTGLMMNKEWLSAEDARVRPAHAVVDGNKVDMEGYFNVGGFEMLVPGARTAKNGLPIPANLVCNCRCVALYQPVRVEGKLIEFNYHVWDRVAA